VVVQSTEECDVKGWFWETSFIPDDQEVEAELVASFDDLRCSGAPAIARRS
jgi:hypothetical protein